MHSFSVFECSSVKVVVGKFFTGGGLEEISTLASLMLVFNDAVVLVGVFIFVAGHLCHLESDRFSSLSDVPCQLSSFSSLRTRGFRDFNSSGMNPPLYCLTSGFLLMFVPFWVPVALPPIKLKLHCSRAGLSNKICEYAYRKSSVENRVC